MPLSGESHALCEAWAREIKYVPNPKHKLYPARYGLTVPPYSRKVGTCCEAELPELKPAESVRLLKEAFRLCLVSVARKEGCPSRVWAVTRNAAGDDIVCEARYERRDNDDGRIVYHGFPYQPSKAPFYEKVVLEWNRRKKRLDETESCP